MPAVRLPPKGSAASKTVAVPLRTTITRVTTGLKQVSKH
jgi:hypothetical protein